MQIFHARSPQGQAGHRGAGQRVLPLVMPLLVAIMSFILYWHTCFRSITWWDNAEYSLAAGTLGICAPPGSLLLTLIGWVVTRLPLANSAAFELNLLAGALAATTAALVCLVALRIIDRYAPPGWSAARPQVSVVAATAVALGSLIFAFAETLWLHAVQFTPYILTALFTAMILYAMFRWWERADRAGSLRWLFVLALLFGLDFSVHRTNAVLLPGLFFWVLLRRPYTLASAKTWLSGLAGLAIGLSVQFVLIPLASRAPFMNMGNPDSWSRFWDYVSIRMAGGGFLVSFFPRKAAFFSEQVGDWLNAFSVNFLHYDSSLSLLGWFPALLGVLGLVLLWRKDARLGVAFTIFFLLTAATTIMYFNIPSGFFRSLHRHYLPTLLVFA
ncbi:MAG: DUF2723 domain-containing protein, partial [candidate division Zixibacteria bacterium]|nr:DUF2723 domain-containing protein [candidate division Zixibacteria bacterium]